MDVKLILTPPRSWIDGKDDVVARERLLALI
jgi:hypothetical protein